MSPSSESLSTQRSLPGKAVDTLAWLAGWRWSLYLIFAGTALFVVAGFVLFAVAFPTDAIEPLLPPWLSGTLAFVLSDLPAIVLDFAEKYPYLALGAVGLIWLIRTLSRIVKDTAQEYTFQAWRLIVAAAPGQAPSTPPPPSTGRMLWGIPVALAWFPGLFLPLVALAVVLVVNRSPATYAAGAAENLAGCEDVQGDCRLAPGESMLVTLRADQPRNETGLMLEQGETYTARFISNVGWRDASKEPRREGFESFETVLGVPKFIWMRWRRPLPEGRWFEVVGRIDHEREAFSILDADDARRPHEFTAPKEGELVLLVNDVKFDNNGGVMTLYISRPRQ